MLKKGNGYVGTTIVAEAMRGCGCPEEKFRNCAEKFGQSVESFAGWTVIKTPEVIRRKMISLGVPCSGGSNRQPLHQPARYFGEERFA